MFLFGGSMRLLLLLCLAGCGEFKNLRHTNPDWIVVGKAIFGITKGYAAAPIVTAINYVEVEKGKFEVTFNPASFEVDEDTLGLGIITINKININKLRICGGKCTSALIRSYTDTPGYPNIEGLVNTVYSNGEPLLLDSGLVGLLGNYLTLDSYTIPTNDRRLRNNDFTNLSYILTADLSNAEEGAYTTTIILEIVVGS